MTFSHLSLTCRRAVIPLAALAVLLRVSLPAGTVETYYSRGVFPIIRTVFDALLGWVPIPLFYAFWLIVIYRIATGFLKIIRGYRAARRELSVRGAVAGATVEVLVQWSTGILLLITIFLLGWGLNYGRHPVDEVLTITRYSPTLAELRGFVHTEAEELATLRATFTEDTSALTAALFPADLEAAVRPHLVAALVAHGYPAPGRPNVRQLRPRGVLLRWGTSGVYWPWAFEANMDAGLHPLQKPSVMAHELAHAYGFGDEGTCNFWAWLAGTQAQDPSLAYAYRLTYWRRMAGKLRRAEPDAYALWRKDSLAPGIRNDLAAIYATAALYPTLAPALRDQTYNAYLKVQGVEEGLLSYGTVIELVEGYRRRPR